MELTSAHSWDQFISNWYSLEQQIPATYHLPGELFENHRGGQMVLQTAQEGRGISLEVLRTDLDKILGSPVADPALRMGPD